MYNGSQMDRVKIDLDDDELLRSLCFNDDIKIWQEFLHTKPFNNRNKS